MNDLINIRILQHDTDDNIRIGTSFAVVNIEHAETIAKVMYEKRTEWCGGFEAACEQFYKRVAIVNAETLEVLQTIYNK